MRLRTALPASLLLTVVVAATGPRTGAWTEAHAQQDGAEQRARDREVDEAVERLRNNPFFASYPDRVRDLVHMLFEQRTPRADDALRRLLADASAQASVVEQIAAAALLDGSHRFVGDVVARVQREGGGTLEERLAPTLLHVPSGTVRRLGDIARDTPRPAGQRLAAVRLLGRTGDAAALDTLAALWAGPEREYREPARAAFDAILPGAAASAAEASSVVESIRREDLPVSEYLRRMLVQRARAGQGDRGSVSTGDYAQLAREFLPSATLDQVLRLYLADSPLADVRELAARRIAEFPWDAAGDPDGKLRAARAAFEALRREESAAVEAAILSALVSLAPALRGNVATEEIESVLVRVRTRESTSRETRLLATRLVGELREVRAVPALQAQYDALGDADPEARLAVLDALQQIPVDITPWLVERIEGQANVRIVRKLVVLLHRGRDPAAVASFRRLLETHPDQQVRWDVAKALGTLWAGTGAPEARDALLVVGVADADPTVRTTCVASLGFPGPGKDAVIARLQRVVAQDLDLRVRQAAAKSIMDLDEAATIRNLEAALADDPAIWSMVCNALVESLHRRDRSPDRVLEAATQLVAAGHRTLAIEVLEQADAARPELWDDTSGRARLRERLARLDLDAGRPAEAERVARALIAAAPDDDAGRRGEILLCEALTASGVREKLLDAERRLETLTADLRLDASAAGLCAATLGACRLGLSDPVGALDALGGVRLADLPKDLRIRVEGLIDDARRKAEEERKVVLAWAEALSGPDAAAARAALTRSGWRAARHLTAALAEARDVAGLRRLLPSVEVVAGRSFAALGPQTTQEQATAVAQAAREALAAVARPARLSADR